jgi:hypothetical protein
MYRFIKIKEEKEATILSVKTNLLPHKKKTIKILSFNIYKINKKNNFLIYTIFSDVHYGKSRY